MQINATSGLLQGVRFICSPHCDERPADTIIDLLVVHGISMPPGEFGGDAIAQLFTGTLDATAHPAFAEVAGLRVSAHVLIRRDGELIQFVPFQKRAWHAGQSVFKGRTQCNDYSIGVELEGTDQTPYANVQYQQLANLISCLQQTYPEITNERIIGHSDIAPGRKTDPGPAFDWDYLHEIFNFS